jgi:hypothetical protein
VEWEVDGDCEPIETYAVIDIGCEQIPVQNGELVDVYCLCQPAPPGGSGSSASSGGHSNSSGSGSASGASSGSGGGGHSSSDAAGDSGSGSSSGGGSGGSNSSVADPCACIFGSGSSGGGGSSGGSSDAGDSGGSSSSGGGTCGCPNDPPSGSSASGSSLSSGGSGGGSGSGSGSSDGDFADDAAYADSSSSGPGSGSIGSSGSSGSSGTPQSSGSSGSSSSGGPTEPCCIAIPGNEHDPLFVASDMVVLRVVAIDGEGNEVICEIDLCAVEPGPDPAEQQFCAPEGDVVRPAILTMQYVGTSCEDQAHGQDPNGVWCDEFVLELPETAWIVGSTSSDPSAGTVWCEGWVDLGNVFDVAASHAGQARLHETTFIHVLEAPGGMVLQSIGLNTTCSQPLDYGDRFGASMIVDVVDDLTAGGDVNLDGRVDFADLVRVIATWGSCDGCYEDVDANGQVDFADVQVILANWSN